MKLVAAAERRNAAHVEAGRARFECAAFQELGMAPGSLDLIFAHRLAAGLAAAGYVVGDLAIGGPTPAASVLGRSGS